jgi:ornithine--oxo-acid transaminase
MICVVRADKIGEDFRQQLRAVQESYPHMIKEVRGRGLLNAVELRTSGLGHVTAYDVCIGLKDRGVLAKPTHGNIIRLSPPLIIK